MLKNQVTQIFSLIIFSFIVLMAIRLSLYGFYPDDFSDLSRSEFLASILMGFRVDMIDIFTFSSAFVLLLLAIKNTKLRIVIALLWAVVLDTIFVLSFSDVLYYDYIHRHISNELFHLANDTDIIIGMAFGSMLIYTILATLFKPKYRVLNFHFYDMRNGYMQIEIATYLKLGSSNISKIILKSGN